MNEQTELEIKEKLAREEFRLRSLAEPEENTTICEVCGKPGAYATPVDPNHKICFDCRELLHCNHTGWVTSNPEADKHGGKGY